MNTTTELHKYEQKITYETYINLRNYLYAISAKQAGKHQYRRVNTLPIDAGVVSDSKRFAVKVYDYEDIVLEKKQCIDGVYNVQIVPLTRSECRNLINGDIHWMWHSDEMLICELYEYMRTYDIKMCDIKSGIEEMFLYDGIKISLERTGVRTLDYHYFLDEDKNMITFIGGDITINLFDETCKKTVCVEEVKNKLLAEGADIRLQIWNLID